MALLTGRASITRLSVTGRPEQPDFDQARFTEIQPGSSVTERVGFVPFEPDAPYQVGHDRFAFRVRMDQVRPDPTAVRERVKQMMVAEKEHTGSAAVSPRRRHKLREEAEEELTRRSLPRPRVVECCLDGEIVYVGTCSDTQLGTIISLMRQIGISCDFLTPWGERNESDVESGILVADKPGQAVLGCRFIKALLGDPEVQLINEGGSARLQTTDAKVTLTGAIQGELLAYVKRGAEILEATLATAESTFRLQGLGFRLAGLAVETGHQDTWIELLDERLEKISAVFELLDRKYAELSARLHRL